MPFVVGVLCSFCGKDAGSIDSSALDATEDAVRRASSVRRRHNAYFARPSYKPASPSRRRSFSSSSASRCASTVFWSTRRETTVE